MRKFLLLSLFASLLMSCSEKGAPETEIFEETERTLLIASEGNYQQANASLSSYTPSEKSFENEIFKRANGQLLGDTAQSLTLHGDKVWIATSNSGIIYAIDKKSYLEVGRITGLTAPRYIHFVSDEKAYVTQIWDNRIAIINPKTYSIEGYITTSMDSQTASTDQMVQKGDFLYVNCWSYQNRLLKIDMRSDKIVAELEVGVQPCALALDKRGKLWTLTDGGGWEGNPAGYEAPSLVRVDPESFTIEKRYEMPLGNSFSKLLLNSAGDTLYWLATGVFRMSIDSEELPKEAVVASDFSYCYGLMLDSKNDDIYVSDALDFTQAGVVVRYSASGKELDRFKAGVCPSAFCWVE